MEEMENYRRAVLRIAAGDGRKARWQKACTKRYAEIVRLRRLRLRIGALAACVLLCAAVPLLTRRYADQVSYPLSISVNAIGEDGEPVQTVMREGQKLRLHREAFYYRGKVSMEGYGLNLSLLEGTYIALIPINEDGSIPQKKKDVESQWVLRWMDPEMDIEEQRSITANPARILQVFSKSDENHIDYEVADVFRTGEWTPFVCCSTLLWRPGGTVSEQNYAHLVTYDDDFNILAVTVVHFTGDENGCEAEIVSVEKYV